MRYKPCDEIAVDTLGAERRTAEELSVACKLDIHVVTALVERVSRLYKGGRNFESILDMALGERRITEEPERTGYKKALGLIFYRRRQRSESGEAQLHELESIAHRTPREQYG